MKNLARDDELLGLSTSSCWLLKLSQPLPLSRSMSICGTPSSAKRAAHESSAHTVPIKIITSNTRSSSAAPDEKIDKTDDEITS